MKKVLLTSLIIGFIFSVKASPKISSTLVISQIYGDGGTTGSTYLNDFIEIYNRGTTAINLSNYSVQYSTGTTWLATPLTAVVLQPGSYYLIKEASNGSSGLAISNPDVTGTISLHANNGKVALVNSTTALSNGCSSALIIDLVGYGNASCYEGTPITTVGSNTVSMIRTAGNPDTDNNSVDFTTATPTPRTSSFTLPFSLFDFSANKNGNSNELHWQLNCLTSSVTFEVQRSEKGQNFETIYLENATQARCAAPFKAEDTNPLNGTNFYRLKITDNDKNILYSKIALIQNNIKSQPALTVYPTRVSSEAILKYTSPNAENIHWLLTDMQGRIIKRITSFVTIGENNIHIPTAELLSGQYQLQGSTNHSTTTAVKFIKQ